MEERPGSILGRDFAVDRIRFGTDFFGTVFSRLGPGEVGGLALTSRDPARGGGIAGRDGWDGIKRCHAPFLHRRTRSAASIGAGTGFRSDARWACRAFCTKYRFFGERNAQSRTAPRWAGDSGKHESAPLPIVENRRVSGIAMFSPRPAFFRPVLVLLVFCSFVTAVEAQSLRASPFPPDAPEHEALTEASAFLGDEKFSLRQDYWQGALTTKAGTAIRLQFFKGNTYRLFFGVAPSTLPKDGKLQLHLYNAANEEVAGATGEAGKPALALHFENTLKTGLYLVLMRVELPPGPLAEEEVPAVMFYGWQ